MRPSQSIPVPSIPAATVPAQSIASQSTPAQATPAALTQSRQPSVVRIRKQTSLTDESVPTATSIASELDMANEKKSVVLSPDPSLYSMEEKSATPRAPRLEDAPALLDVPKSSLTPDSVRDINQHSVESGDSQMEIDEEQPRPRAISKAVNRKIASKPGFDFSSLAPKAQVRVARNGTYSMRFSHAVKQVIVEDETYCQAVVTAANEVSVIGREEGKTRIAIQLLAKESVETTVLEVSTVATWETPVSKSAEEIARLNKSVQEMFPNAKVSIVRAEDGAVSVSGFVEDEAVARNILSLVRRICLVPVKDMVVVKAP
jgi:hypothetical protein